MSRILFAAKQRWMILRMSRPLFEGTYLQVVVGFWPIKNRNNLQRIIIINLLLSHLLCRGIGATVITFSSRTFFLFMLPP